MAVHLGLFDAVLASDGATNLKGDAKGAALVETLTRQELSEQAVRTTDEQTTREAE